MKRLDIVLVGISALLLSAGVAAAASAINSRALPLGDGKVASVPRIGYVDSCQTTFPPNAPGAFAAGPWIKANGTWDATAKVSVHGNVSWPQARYAVRRIGTRRIITTADLPVRQGTGVFPIAPSDPAYQYDRNPNRIEMQSIHLTLAANPKRANSPSCLNLGPIGVLKDGVVLFDALDAGGRDAVAHEILDRCAGHPQQAGMYHHHDVPACLLRTARSRSTLVGYALDGFGIYVERNAAGHLLTNSQLDACHGRTSTVRWDGKSVRMYHYVATLEYPYTVGCYRGSPTSLAITK